MLGYILEIQKNNKRKERLEKEILLLRECISRKRALEELNHLLCLETKFTEKSKNIKARIRNLEREIYQVDEKINLASSSLYGFGISDYQRFCTDEKVNSFNEVKSKLYEQLMENMEAVRKLSLDIVKAREKVSRAKDRYEDICLEIEEKAEKMNSKIRKIEKDIRRGKEKLADEIEQNEALELILAGRIELFRAVEDKCSSCMAKICEKDVLESEGVAIVLCKKCGCALYICKEKGCVDEMKEEIV